MCFVEDKGFDEVAEIVAGQADGAVDQKLFGKIQRNGWNEMMIGSTVRYSRRHKLPNDVGGSFASIHAALDDVIISIRKANLPRHAKIFVPFLGHGRLFAVGEGLSTANLYTDRRSREPI